MIRLLDETGAELGEGLVALDSAWALGETCGAYNDEETSSSGMMGPSRGESKSCSEQEMSSSQQGNGSMSAVSTVSGPRVRHEIDLLSGGVHLGTASFGVRISECLMPSNDNPERSMPGNL